MTTATLTRRSTNYTGKMSPEELKVYYWLVRQGYQVCRAEVEREQFRTGRGKALAPDIRVRGLPWGVIPRNVKLFLELTRGDFFTEASQLAPAVLAKNLAYGDSGKDFLEAPEYLQRKLLKIDRAERRDRRLMVILLTDELQHKIMADPDLLRRIIEERFAERHVRHLRRPRRQRHDLRIAA